MCIFHVNRVKLLFLFLYDSLAVVITLAIKNRSKLEMNSLFKKEQPSQDRVLKWIFSLKISFAAFFSTGPMFLKKCNSYTFHRKQVNVAWSPFKFTESRSVVADVDFWIIQAIFHNLLSSCGLFPLYREYQR